MPNFNFKSQFPIAEVIAAAQRKPQLEAQIAAEKEAMRQARFKTLLDALSTGAQVARLTSQNKTEALAREAAKSSMAGQAETTSILQEPSLTSPAARPIQQFERSYQPPTGIGPELPGPLVPKQQTVQPTFGGTEFGATQPNRLVAALSKGFPKETAESLLESRFGTGGKFGGIGKPVAYRDETTNTTRWGKWDPDTQSIIRNPATDPPVGYAEGLVTIPGTGGMGSFERSSGTVTPVAPPELPSGTAEANNSLIELRQKAPKVSADVEAARAKSFPQNNTSLRDQVSAAASAQTALDILRDKNPSSVALSSLGFAFAIMSGSNSQLSDAEREAFAEPLSFLRKLENKGYKIIAGDLSPKMKSDLSRLAVVLKNKTKSKARAMIEGTKLEARGTAGQYWNKKIEDTWPTLEDIIANEQSSIISNAQGGTGYENLSDEDLEAQIRALQGK